MIIYPAIDLKGGRVVRLEQGLAERETLYFQDAATPAAAWKAAGATWVHVVDLDGAFTGEARNWDAISAILAEGMAVELGGGMRDHSTVAQAIAHGVQRVVIGTKALQEPAFVEALVAEFGDKIAVGIDAREGKVAIKGWVEVSQKDASEMAVEMAQRGVKTIIYTDISRDGMLTGPNFEAQEALCRAVAPHGCEIIASGGVARIEDIQHFATMAKELPNLNGVITGKALYDGQIDLQKALRYQAEHPRRS